jgi:long-chain acyl-CoA synthetase
MANSIPENFFDVVKKYPQKIALSYKKEGVYFPITYKELSQKVKSLATGLKNLGVARGDKVAILSENRPEWVVCDLAIMAIGAITVPLHTTFSSKVLCNVVKHSRAKILIVSKQDLLNKLLAGKEDLKLEKIILIEKASDWEPLFEKNNFQEIELNSDEPCSIIYTSGTTGEPKGVVLSCKNFLSNVESVNKIVPVLPSDIFLSFLPISHVLERTAGYYMPLLSGATIVYSEGIKKLVDNLKEVRPTIMISVPRIFEKFHDVIWDKINSSSPLKKKISIWALKQKKNTFGYKIADILVFKKIRYALGGNFRFIVSGGASLNKNVAKFFAKIGVLVLEGYGLTETSPVIAVNLVNEYKFGTVGKIVPDVQVKISNEKEVLVKGPNVFNSYFENKEETQKVIDQEGWFHTGDLGFIDKEGFLTIIGRRKEMIVTSGGKNVWPEHLEGILNNDKFVSQSMIVGHNKKFVSALIVPDWQELEIFLKEKNIPLQDRKNLVENPTILSLFEERMTNNINSNLSEYEKIKKFSLLFEEFSQAQDELTPTLKLRRHIIERHYQEKIESMYE